MDTYFNSKRLAFEAKDCFKKGDNEGGRRKLLKAAGYILTELSNEQRPAAEVAEQIGLVFYWLYNVVKCDTIKYAYQELIRNSHHFEYDKIKQLTIDKDHIEYKCPSSSFESIERDTKPFGQYSYSEEQVVDTYYIEIVSAKDKNSLIRAVIDIFSFSLDESMAIVDNLPIIIASQLTIGEAEFLAQDFRDSGGDIIVNIGKDLVQIK